MLALEKEYNDLKAVLASIETKASATGVKSGSLLSEYASYKRKIRGAILAAEKKLADARFDLIKAKERLKGGDD